MTTQQMIVSA